MVDKIKTGAMPIESLSYLSAWRWAKNLNSYGLDRRIREAGRRLFYLAARQQTLWMLFLYLVAVIARVWAETGSPVPTMETLMARMAQARVENQARFCSYVVTRDYKLFGKEQDKIKSQVIADVTFVPPDSKKYAIQQSMGSGLGEKVVRRMLAREADITKDCRSTDFSPENYEFRFLRQEEVDSQRCYVLELLPKRQDRNLVRGNIWVDVNTYLLRRTEGEPAKSPSWWLRDVRLVFVYGEVGGMWLQTASEASAYVRILGLYKMVSRDVKYQLNELVAAGPQQASQVDIPWVGSTLRHPSSLK